METNVNKGLRTAGCIVAGTALSMVPLVSVPGDCLYEAHKIKKLEKCPMKDCFKKVAENHGEKYCNWFSKLNKFSKTKVGTIGLGIASLIDIALNVWVITVFSKAIQRNRKVK